MDAIGWAFFTLFFIIIAIAVIAPRFTKDQTEEW